MGIYIRSKGGGANTKWDSTETVSIGDPRYDNGEWYENITGTNTAVRPSLDPTNWKKVTSSPITDQEQNQLDNAPKAYDINGGPYPIGTAVFDSGTVYKANELIPSPAGAFDPLKWDEDTDNKFRGYHPGDARPTQGSVSVGTGKWIREGDYVIVSSDDIAEGVQLYKDDILTATKERPNDMTEWSLNRAQGSEAVVTLLKDGLFPKEFFKIFRHVFENHAYDSDEDARDAVDSVLVGEFYVAGENHLMAIPGSPIQRFS